MSGAPGAQATRDGTWLVSCFAALWSFPGEGAENKRNVELREFP